MLKTLYVDHTPAGRQTVNRVEVLTLTAPVKSGLKAPVMVEHTLRLSLRLDSYAEQCHARVERWDGTQWHEVVSIAHPLMALVTEKVSPYHPNACAHAAWEIDRNALLMKAGAVLL